MPIKLILLLNYMFVCLYDHSVCVEQLINFQEYNIRLRTIYNSHEQQQFASHMHQIIVVTSVRDLCIGIYYYYNICARNIKTKQNIMKIKHNAMKTSKNSMETEQKPSKSSIMPRKLSKNSAKTKQKFHVN
jgi:hypothetical protein